jgi:hypothetical protein
MQDTFREYKFDKNMKAKYGKYIVKKFKKKYVKYSFGVNRTQALSEE